MIDTLLRGNPPPGIEALAPLLMRGTESVFDFLPDDTLLVVDDLPAGQARMLKYAEEMVDNHLLAVESGRLVAKPEQLAIPPGALEEAVLQRNAVLLDRLDLSDAAGAKRFGVHAPDQDELRRALIRTRAHDEALAPLVEKIEEWQEKKYRIVLAASSLSHAERLKALLNEYGVAATVAQDPRPAWRWSSPGRVEVRTVTLSAGFQLSAEKLVVVTEEEIFGPREKRRKRRKGWPAGAAVEALGQLSPGDYLVHAEHGIGIYRGLVELELRGSEGEFLRLEYAEEARLFLPVHRLNLVQRYAGSDGHVPRIDKLGGLTWEKAKRQVKKSLRDMAKELLSVHAARELAVGTAFSARDRLFEEFEAAFPYEETPDQLNAIEDSLADMQQEKPMDRIVCGDVGFGKTEVAVRAAFRAAMDGKQTAVLVPTTILCQQHEETFRERFKGYPVRIEALSRFQSPKQSRIVREGLASGEIDVVIGTHRLLQKSIQFRDLGLLVVDEEQRFGVAHKERIKQLKKTGGRADAHRDADPAYPPARLHRAARPLRDRHAAGGPTLRAHPGVSLLGDDHPRGDPARDAPRWSGLLRAQPRADHRRDGRHAREDRARGEGDRGPWPDEGARARRADARVHAPRGGRIALHDHHRERRRQSQRQHDPDQPRRRPRPGPALPAARPASGAAITAPMPT